MAQLEFAVPGRRVKPRAKAYTQELLSSIPGKHWQPPATGLDTAEVACCAFSPL